MTSLTIYTDGASSGNPGPGGYAAVIISGRQRQEVSGGFRMTTNNRMELYAAIAGLESLQGRQVVKLYSDSQYLVESLNQGWVQAWQAKGWRKTKKEKVPNSDLWKRLLRLLEKHQVVFEWVEGHSGHPLNERANWLAQRSIRSVNLPADEGYEQLAEDGGEFQAGLFDITGDSENVDAQSTDRAKGAAKTTASRKVTSEGQACRKCGAPVEKRKPTRKVKPGQSYYYEYYLQCPKCGTIYLVEDARRGN
jgi:ribonuclease HI